MTEIIKKGDSYWYGDIEMEPTPISNNTRCSDCPIYMQCKKELRLRCSLLVGREHIFKLKENKTMTETSKLFTIDNGDKQFKAKLWLEERNVCFQVLEQAWLDRDDRTIRDSNYSVLRYAYISMNFLNTNSNVAAKDFDTNADRDAYYAKACGWLQEFCDVNSKVDNFEYADVSKIFGNDFMYKDEDKSCESVFYRGMAQDNFAGIEYEGHPNEWFTDRIVMLNGQPRISTTTLFESDTKQAIPTRIRFFKAIK